MLDEILQKVGLKYDELTSEEKETLHSWVDALGQSSLSVAKVKDHITTMRHAVSLELVKTKGDSKKDMHLKARLNNYVLLEALLSTPEKAQEALDRALAGIATSKK